MKLWRGFEQIQQRSSATVATIGNFDGVHLGHQALLRLLRLEANRLQLPLVVMLFEPQPAEYFQKEAAPARLSTLREKLEVLRECGVDDVVCVKFDQKWASMLPLEFAEHYVFLGLNAKYLLMGEDFRFGRERAGDMMLLSELGKKHACDVHTFPDFYIDQQRVSSTKIRQALSVGALEQSASFLGRTYSMCGRVVHGAGRGRQWGFPTANLMLNRKTLPLSGVFCVQVKQEGRALLAGVANIGCRPTIDGSRNVLEIHLLDVDVSIYGEMLQVFFLHKLRDEIKFSSVNELKIKIHEDIAEAKSWFNRIHEII